MGKFKGTKNVAAVFFCFLLLLVVTLKVNAQGINFKSGITASNLFPSTYIDTSYDINRIRSVLSPFIDLNYTFHGKSIFGFKIGLEYVRIEADFGKNGKYYQSQKMMNINCNYLKIPIELAFIANRYKVYYPDIFIGLAPSVNFSSMIIAPDYEPLDSAYVYDPIDYGDKFSIDFRAGIQYRIFKNIGVGINYGVSLNDVSKKLFFLKDYKFQYWQLYLEQNIFGTSQENVQCPMSTKNLRTLFL